MHLAWTILEILALIALVIFSISLAWRVGAFSMGQWKQRAKNAKQGMMAKLRADLLENERGAEREAHLRAMRVVAQNPGNLEDPSTLGYAPRP